MHATLTNFVVGRVPWIMEELNMNNIIVFSEYSLCYGHRCLKYKSCTLGRALWLYNRKIEEANQKDGTLEAER